MNQQKQNGNIIAIITMFFLFAMISFVTNLAAPFGTIWKNQYAGANTLGMMGNMMNFLAYLFMGIPSGNMLVKIGYKKTATLNGRICFQTFNSRFHRFVYPIYFQFVRCRYRRIQFRRICH